jgi:TPR repeat protein
MYNIGVMYDSGNGVSRNHAVAAEWYRQAIDGNFAPAMYNLGLLYEYGMSLKQDYAMAMQLYRRAAELGEPLAQFAIALLYDKGLGVEPDLVQAYMWFDITGDGHENAIFNRDSVATDMQPEQIARARQLAAEWRAARPQLFPPTGAPPRP